MRSGTERRISDTRVRRVPAVAKCESVVVVAEVSAERPVHAPTPSENTHQSVRIRSPYSFVRGCRRGMMLISRPTSGEWHPRCAKRYASAYTPESGRKFHSVFTRIVALKSETSRSSCVKHTVVCQTRISIRA